MMAEQFTSDRDDLAEVLWVREYRHADSLWEETPEVVQGFLEDATVIIRAGFHRNTDAQENWEHYRWLADQRGAALGRVEKLCDLREEQGLEEVRVDDVRAMLRKEETSDV